MTRWFLFLRCLSQKHEIHNTERKNMSKKKIYNKHLEKGRFYIHSDGHGGHPALLYKKRDKKKRL